jgi:hypothetical protein
MKTKQPTIAHTLSEYATSSGQEDRTLKRKFVKNGFDFKPHEKIPLMAYNCAMLGEKAEVDIQLKRAQALAQEMENKIKQGEMIPLETLLKWQSDVLGAIRSRILALSGNMAHLCNPTDPAFAQAALDRWIAETLSMLRTEISKTK